MTDPIERVARMLAEINGHGQEWGDFVDYAAQVITRFAEQGIPIDKLLSGEMRAVNVSPTENDLKRTDAAIHDNWPNARKMAMNAWGEMVSKEETRP